MAVYACQSCGVGYERTGNYQKWCPQCRVVQTKRRYEEFEQRQRHACPGCGKVIARTSVQCRICATKVGAAKRSRENSVNWKGGQSRSKGYVYILVAPEARKGHRYRAEHMLVWEQANGPIPKGYIIHHRNGKKDDNRLENLEALPRNEHNHRHDEHDRRIVELEAEVARLREQLNANSHSKV